MTGKQPIKALRQGRRKTVPTAMVNSPALISGFASNGSPTLLPNDHVRMLLELLRPAGGGGPELARRWLAALMLVPIHERADVVQAVEREVSRTYAAVGRGSGKGAASWSVHHAPVQKDGYVEEVVKTYEEVEPKPEAKAKAKRRAR